MHRYIASGVRQVPVRLLFHLNCIRGRPVFSSETASYSKLTKTIYEKTLTCDLFHNEPGPVLFSALADYKNKYPLTK